MTKTPKGSTTPILAWALYTAALVSTMLVGSSSPGLAQTGAIQYIYDELGRLVAVVDAAGQTAVYTYDPVGNLLSIGRHGPSDVSVIEFTPDSGPVNTTVTIHGTGFSSTAAQNSVAFNGTPATVISATTTQLVTNVPAGATSGPIAITTPSGSTTSATPFTVAPTLVPTISGFSPAIGVVGSSVTITGTNFDLVAARNRVKFNATVGSVSTAAASTLTATVPPFVASGRISVTTSYGTSVSADDFFVAPAPYTASDVLFTGRTSIGGSANVALGTPSKIGLLVFDGAVNQRVSVTATMTSGNWGCSWSLQILQTNGSLLGEAGICSTVGWLEPQTLPASGTYTVVLDPAGTFTGTAAVNLYSVVDVTTPIVANGPAVTAPLTTPGQDARLPFTGIAGHRMSVLVTLSSGTFGCSVPIEIRKAADNALIGASTSMCGSSGFVEPVTLPASDNYVVVVNPVGSNTGTANVSLHDVVDVTTPIVINGSAVTAPLTAPGQNARLPFTGASAQRVNLSVVVTSGSFGCLSLIEIRTAADNSLVGTAFMCSSSGSLGPVTLPATTDYVAVVNPLTSSTGTANVTLTEVP